MIKSSLPIQDTARAEFCSEYLPLNYLRLKRKCKEKINLMLLPQINQQVSGIGMKFITWGSYFPSWWKCIYLWSIWSWPVSGTGYWPGQTLALTQDGRSPQLSNVSAQKNLGEISRSPQEMLSLQPKLSFILMKFMTASLFYKPASFPQNMMYFSKSYKTVILPASTEKYPEISVTLKQPETETL